MLENCFQSTRKTISELYSGDNKSKYYSNPKHIFNLEKKIIKLFTSRRQLPKLPEFLTSIINRKKISNEQFNLVEAKISLD